MKIKIFILALIVAFVGIHSSAYAATFEKGDVFAGTASGTIEHWRPGSGYLGSYSSGGSSYVTGMAFDAVGKLFATNFSNSNVSMLAGPTDPHTASLYVNQGSNPETIVFDKFGNAYVGSASNGDIKKYDTAGNLLLSMNTGDRADWIDLSADNTKIYFTEDAWKGVFILDIASGTRSTFNANLGNFALRLLGDGSVLVANRENIVFLDNSGNFVRSYDVGGNNSWFALNIDPDGKTFWSADFNTGLIQQFDIATGTLMTQFNSGNAGGPWGLAVFGEITVARPKVTVVLTPQTATNPLWSTHTLEALVKDQDGNPIKDVIVTFLVDGENHQTGTAVTNESGIATWSYIGEFLGTDTIVASTDSATSNSVTKEWVLVNTPGRIVAWGGYSYTGSFNFNILSNGLYPVGTFYYSDRVRVLTLWSNQITGLMISSDKKKAVFTGKVKIGGVAGYRFEVYVNDNGNPGINDKFIMIIYDPSNTVGIYGDGGTLFTGNIQIYP